MFPLYLIHNWGRVADWEIDTETNIRCGQYLFPSIRLSKTLVLTSTLNFCILFCLPNVGSPEKKPQLNFILSFTHSVHISTTCRCLPTFLFLVYLSFICFASIIFSLPLWFYYEISFPWLETFFLFCFIRSYEHTYINLQTNNCL